MMTDKKTARRVIILQDCEVHPPEFSSFRYFRKDQTVTISEAWYRELQRAHAGCFADVLKQSEPEDDNAG